MFDKEKHKAILEPKETKEEKPEEKPHERCGCLCHPGFEQPPWFSNYSLKKCKHCESTIK